MPKLTAYAIEADDLETFNVKLAKEIADLAFPPQDRLHELHFSTAAFPALNEFSEPGLIYCALLVVERVD